MTAMTGFVKLIVGPFRPGVTVRPIPFLDGVNHFNEGPVEVGGPTNMVLARPGLAAWDDVGTDP